MFYMSDSNDLMEETTQYDAVRAISPEKMKVASKTKNPAEDRASLYSRNKEWSTWPQYIRNFALLFIIVFIPTFIFNLLFSDMTPAGLGTQTFSFLSTKYTVAVAAGSFGFITLVLTYLFDGFKYWRDA